MKSLTLPISIFITFIVFIIIDSNGAYHCNHLQTGKTINNEFFFESTSNPVLEIIPVIKPEPMTEANLAETKETENVATTTRSSPAVIPILTLEEAAKANDEALRFQQDREKNTLEKRVIKETKDSKSLAKKTNKAMYYPAAIPVLTPEEAIKANKEALSFTRKITIAKAFQAFSRKIGLNNNRIHFILSLLPLLLIFDLFLFKRRNKSNYIAPR